MTTIIYQHDRENERHIITADSRCTEGVGIWSNNLDKVYVCEYFIAALAGSQKDAIIFEILERSIRSREHELADEAEDCAIESAIESVDVDKLISEGFEDDDEICIPITKEHLDSGFRDVASFEGLDIEDGFGIPFNVRSRLDLYPLLKSAIGVISVDIAEIIIAFRGSSKAYNIDIDSDGTFGIVEIPDDVAFCGSGSWVARAVYPLVKCNLQKTFDATAKIDPGTNSNIKTKSIKY